MNCRTRATGAPPTPPAPFGDGKSADGLPVQDIIRALVVALGANGTVTPEAKVPPPVILSPIDKAHGGEALAGKKTALSVAAFAALSILQSLDVVGPGMGDTATTTGSILTTLIAAFGSLGLLGKADRFVEAIGLLATKPPPK